MVTRACEPFAYTDWLRPSRMTFGCGSRARNVRRDDVDVMPAPACLAGEEVHVLADAAEVRIVVLRDQRDAQRALVVRVRAEPEDSGAPAGAEARRYWKEESRAA